MINKKKVNKPIIRETSFIRVLGRKKVDEAILKGNLPYPSKCSVCGRKEGKLEYFIPDYENPIRSCKVLCTPCRMIVKNRRHYPENFELLKNTFINTWINKL